MPQLSKNPMIAGGHGKGSTYYGVVRALKAKTLDLSELCELQEPRRGNHRPVPTWAALLSLSSAHMWPERPVCLFMLGESDESRGFIPASTLADLKLCPLLLPPLSQVHARFLPSKINLAAFLRYRGSHEIEGQSEKCGAWKKDCAPGVLYLRIWS